MKKFALLFAFIFTLGNVIAQETVLTWDQLKSRKEKSDIEITDAKKSAKSKTWVKRGDLYYTIYTYNTAGLYKGMPAKGGLASAEILFPNYTQKTEIEGGEVWTYERMKLYFVGGVLDRWEETEKLDNESVLKSAEAYLKAVELDESLKEKSTFQSGVRDTRGGMINEAVEYYNVENFDKAYEYMSVGMKLGELPKLKDDTVFDANLITYYMGIIALKANLTDEARKQFKKSIENKYEAGASYHYMAETYLAEGDSTKFIETVKQGFEVYPQEEQLLIDLINFYINQKKPEIVIEYLDIAISKNPENPSYYSAKGTVYFNEYDEALKRYMKNREDAHEFKKEAFRERNNASKRVEAEKKQKEATDAGDKEYNGIFSNFDKAEKLYNKSLEIDPQFFNSAYNRGSLYLKRSRLYAIEADFVIKINKDFAKSEELTKNSEDALKKSAEMFEIALKIEPKDRDLLNTLKSIYFRLRDNENVARVEGLLLELGAEKSGIK